MDKKNQTAIRSGLRLIANGSVSKPTDQNPTDTQHSAAATPAGPESPSSATSAVKKHPLVSFMSAYADAIDRDVELILGL